MAMPRQHLGAIELLVDDYDRAIAYYPGVLGFTLVEDMPLGDEKRWGLLQPKRAA
ncbi:VOC family protein [Neisseriaceae bacterium JH1-16]|nr:VOC family protein [Neisseriaceae bacterium JH1-16]